MDLQAGITLANEQVPKLVADQDVPGIAVALFNDSEIVSASFGTLARSGSAPVTTTTLFSLQSISKMYTATACLRAVDAGLMSLDERLTSLVPGFTVQSRHEDRPEERITLRHLLNHAAGFTHEAPIGGNYHVGPESFEEHVWSIAHTWLRWPVGQRVEYSNLGVDLAAYALSKRIGGDVETAFRELIYEPLGLTRTTVDVDRLTGDSDRADGHAPSHDRCPLKMPMVGAGGVWGGVEDVARFGQAHLRHELLSAEATNAMLSPPFPAPGQPDGYGFGLGVVTWPTAGRLLRGHSGGGFGFLADLYWLPDLGLGGVVLTNSSSHTIQSSFIHEMFAAALPPDAPTLPPVVEPEAIEFNPERWAPRATTYLGRFGSMRFGIESDAFGVQFELPEGSAQAYWFVPLKPISESAAWIPSTGLGVGQALEFIEGDGQPEAVVSTIDGSFWQADRRDPLEPRARAIVEPYLGDYIVYERGVESSRVRLLIDDDGMLLFGPWSGVNAIGMTHHAGLLFFSSTGEALDLANQPPTYANIALTRAEGDGP